MTGAAQSLSYRELNERANRLAHYLLALPGVAEGGIGLCLERSCELMVAILAILKTGAAYVPLDPEYPAERLRYMAETSAIALVLTSAASAARLPPGNWQTVDPGAVLGQPLPTDNPEKNIAPGQAAYVLFTSGSTGWPKGVALPHRALNNLIDWQIRQSALHDGGRTLQFAPASFDVHFQELFGTWCAGGCLVLVDDATRLDPDALLHCIASQRINRLFLPFVALQNLCTHARGQRADLDCLREIVTAGEQLLVTPALVDFFTRLPGCRLFNHYGPTETHVVSAYPLSGTPANWPQLPPIGQPIDGAELHLLDPQGQPVAEGEAGELFIAGVCLANGYLHQPELTAERFLARPEVAGGRLYRTGDLARRLPDGNFQYLGRIDEQVKLRGYRIEPGEIEAVLCRFPKVAMAAVCVRADPPGERRLVAYLVMAPGEALPLAALRAFLRSTLPDYMQPSAFLALPELPRTPSGKVDRQRLPPPDSARPALDTPYAAPRTALEGVLCALWSQLLGIVPVGRDDNFFDLGGDSLLAMQTVTRLRVEHGIEVPVTRVYMHPTAAAFAAALHDPTHATHPAQASRPLRQDEPIAVIGMALRFPGAETPEAFWHNLRHGVESLTFFSPDELDPSLPGDLVGDPGYVPARGIVRDAAGFDAAFFGMSRNVALITDPQQRIALELAWNALEHAGYDPQRYSGLIGVVAGVGNNSYYLNNVLPHPEAVERVGAFLAMTQNEKDYVATRIAYALKLKGRALSVHTACSTSLSAVVVACEALWLGQCDMMLAGGAAVTSPIRSGQRHEPGAMYSSDGHTRAFDARASGTVFSDGAGMVVLKRYADAVADGDTIYALLKGAALNNDGGDKASFTAPDVAGQSAVIRTALASARVDAASVSYVETHGTATPLGDPIEIEALTRAFRQDTDARQFCAIGSVKTNFGHLTAAAGVAGFLKTVLALHHRELPPSLFYAHANPQIDFAGSPFFVNDRLRPWKTDNADTTDADPLRAGVSAFGVGGTNAHVILEEAPAAPAPAAARSRHLLVLSARTASALALRRSELRAYLQHVPPAALADLCYTLQTGRADFAHRWFACVRDIDDAIAQLAEGDPRRSAARHCTQAADGVVFMFPGQGAQYAGMGSVLYRDEPVFREAVDRCSRHLQPLLGRDLRTLMFAAGGEEEAEAALRQTCYTQPALFTLGYALAQLWMSWGIRPAALIGHSVGEFVAATLAGVFTLEDALTAVASRGRLMQDCPAGSMLSVRLAEEEIRPRLDDTLAIAAVNGTHLCTVAGPCAAIGRLQQRWEAEGVVCKPLQTSHAFHSPMMDGVIAPFAEVLASLPRHAPKIPILSTVTAHWLQDDEARDPLYWARHLRATVRFAAGVQALWAQHPRSFLLELGPRNTACTMARAQASHPETQKAAPSLGESAGDDAEWTKLLAAIGQLWLNGVPIDLRAFHAHGKRRRVGLPGYPFEHTAFWLAPASTPTPCRPDQPAETTPMPPPPPPPPSSGTAPARREHLLAEIIALLENASGLPLQEAERDAAFVELGLDSLLLTQIALSLTRKFGVAISFRQLNDDLASLNRLSGYLDEQLPQQLAQQLPQASPAEPAAAPGSVPGSVPFPAATSGAPAPASGDLQWLIAQQLQIMQQQLQLLQGKAPLPLAAESAKTPAAPEAGATETAHAGQKPFGAIARIEKRSETQFSAAQQRWLDRFIARYCEKTKASKACTQQNRARLADPRVVTGFRPHLKEIIYQPVVNRSLGAQLWDIDGNAYIDVLNGFGSNLFGHNPPFMVAALEEQLHRGYEIGPQHPFAGEVATLICELTGFDRAALCNTGSEAVLGAMRMARTLTGRSQIISFNGSYHGINDEVIVRGSPLGTRPAAAGILPEAVRNMQVIDYGTPESLAIIRRLAGETAAILVEPIQSRRADFQPKEFLQAVRQITAEAGCLLIFDEVITGFRLCPGGAQEYFGVRADLATYGKVIGGGMPIGAIAGRKACMDVLDGGDWQYGDDSVPETGVTYFAGTFVRHPLALAAARASLHRLKASGPALQARLNENTAWLSEEINAFCAQHALPLRMVHSGSLFKLKYAMPLPHADLIYPLLRDKGVHIYDGFPCFLTEAHRREDLEFIATAFRETLRELQEYAFLPGECAPPAPREESETDGQAPPLPGARLGKNPDGSSAWFVPDPDRPGKYLRIKHAREN